MIECELANLKRISKRIRASILKMHNESGSSHVGSSLSCVDILVTLYFCVMRLDSNHDTFVLSKGHAGSALYATLVNRFGWSEDILKQYCSNGSYLPGHCTRGSLPGIEVSTGSLGHGLSVGAGLALAAILDELDKRVFVLLSDGECDEGSVWEAALFSAHHKLKNLIAIIDYNKCQAFGMTNEVLNLEPFRDKWTSFGWSASEVDGHNYNELYDSLSRLPLHRNMPSVIIAHTIKGKGVSFMENKLEWHYRSPNHEQLKTALTELS